MHEHINNSDRFSVYRTFALNIECVPKYLTMNLDRHMKFIFTRFRFGVSDLKVHFFRYRQPLPADLLCNMCDLMCVENEVHFILCCPFYKDLRNTFIPAKFFHIPSSFHLSILLASTNENLIKNLCLFIYFAFKAREKVAS